MAASTVAQYLAALPADRRAALSAVRKAINEHLPDGYEEGMQFGMIGWYVPLSVYPGGLWRESQSAAAIGCARIAEVRFKSLEDLALDVVGRTVARVSGLASVRGRLSLPRGCTSR